MLKFHETRVPLLAVAVLLIFFDLSLARPSEEPTRFTLNTGSGRIAEPASRWQQGKELLGRITDAIRIGRGRLVNSITLAKNIVADRAEQLIASEAQNHVTMAIIGKTNIAEQKQSLLESLRYPSPTFIPPVTRETVRLESELAQAPLEKRKKNNPVQVALEAFLRPTPVVDGIREEDKYGNAGDKFIGVGRALVGGFEGFSNLLNAIVDFPGNILQQKSRSITDTLNQVGAKLIGLQK